MTTLIETETGKKRTRRVPLSDFSKMLLSLVIADVVLVLVLTYGSVFPSREKMPPIEKAQVAQSYDESTKMSPFMKATRVKPKSRRQGRQYTALLMNER